MTGLPRPLSTSETLDWLRLARTENVGPITFRHLLGRYGSARAALDALPALARRGGRQRPLKPASDAAIRREFDETVALGGRIIAACEPGYPPLLAAVDDAPPVITVIGQAQLFMRRTVAIVGARNASANGRLFAQDLAAALGRQGFVIASGLARGIDAAAHEGSLATGTIAVMAGGIDVVYPREHAALRDRIAAAGAIIAESPLGTEPQASHFPRRNRIISGLASGVVVVEAALRSGSLITARFAANQGRDVFAVPGSPLDPRCRGANDLIRQGAILTEGADDVIEALAQPGGQLKDPAGPGFGPPEPAPDSDQDIDKYRVFITGLLGPTPVAVDELIRRCQLSPALVASVLLELDLAGKLERHPGRQVSLVPDWRGSGG
ncbi:MAG: DNA-processing protein DprA [Alphaproteobacteria bacterium]